MKINDKRATRAWAVMVAMSVLAATAVMAQQPVELPEQVAVCAAMRMVAADDSMAP